MVKQIATQSFSASDSFMNAACGTVNEFFFNLIIIISFQIYCLLFLVSLNLSSGKAYFGVLLFEHTQNPWQATL